MTDIVERLEAVMDNAMRPGTANSDINTFSLPIEVTRGDVYSAIAEIKRLRATIDQLRAVAGAVSVELPLLTFADIKKSLKDNG
jgi:hypothetical protein